MGPHRNESGNGSPDSFTRLADMPQYWKSVAKNGKALASGTYRSVDFPDYDLCAGALDEKFDIIIVEQVFEHLLWPYRAARNVFQMLNPNGALLNHHAISGQDS